MNEPPTILPSIQKVCALAWETALGVRTGEVKNCDADQILNGVGKALSAAKQHSLDQLLKMKTKGEFIPLLASETDGVRLLPNENAASQLHAA